MINEDWSFGSSPRFSGNGVTFSQSERSRKGYQ